METVEKDIYVENVVWILNHLVQAHDLPDRKKVEIFDELRVKAIEIREHWEQNGLIKACELEQRNFELLEALKDLVGEVRVKHVEEDGHEDPLWKSANRGLKLIQRIEAISKSTK